MKFFTLKAILLLFAVGLFLNITAQEPKLFSLQYKSPVDGAKYVNTNHSIAIRQGEVFNLKTQHQNLFMVSGSISGIIEGTIKLSADSKTLIFTPDRPFNYNELISVSLNEGLTTTSGRTVKPEHWSFTTMKEDNAYLRDRVVQYFNETIAEKTTANFSPGQTNTALFKNTMALPDDFPTYQVALMNNPGPGYWFVTPHNLFHPLNAPAYSIIMDHYGTPVYYKRNNSHSLDFKIQETGVISQFLAESAAGLGIGYGTFYTYDHSMNVLDTFQMGNGYLAEMHDFQLFNDGSYLLFTYDAQIVDMSELVEGGDPAATVMGFVLQELDMDNNVVFEWSSWDHMEITEATPDINLTGAFIDYCHGNAVERDHDGNILVSFRNTDDIIKINRQTGDIMWRINTNRDDLNDFTFLNDTIQFSHQHDIRRQNDGTITLFDNGNLHNGPSRLLKYQLDEVNKTADLVWVYPPQPGAGQHFAFATGNAHWQPNGNIAAGWGLVFPIVASQLIFGEVTPDYQTTFQVVGLDSNTTYRAHKYVWETNLFNLSKDTINWGQFSGYTPAPYIIQVTNNSDQPITLSGTHNHAQQFYAATAFPLEIAAGATGNITINFFPATQGNFQDVMTIMCQKDEFEMIAKQVVLKGYTEDNTAPEVSIEPTDGTTDVILMPKMNIMLNEKAYNLNGIMISNADLADLIDFKKESETGADVPFNAEITWIDNNLTTIKITPQEVLDEMTDYYLALKASVVQDWTGNVISGNNSVVFTTGNQLGVDEKGDPLKAIAYPNPNAGMFKIAFAENTSKAIMVYDIKGNLVFENKSVSGFETSVNLTHLPSGIYFVRAMDTRTNESFEMKVLKQ